MTTQQTSAPLATLIRLHLPLAEKIFLTSLAVGVIMMVMEIDSSIAGVSLIGLAITFFLSAFKAIDVPPQEDDARVRAVDVPIREDEAGGFSELLGLMIVPKVLWISSAISAFGIGSYILDFGNDGYKEMLMIGGLTIAIGVLLVVALMINGIKNISVLTPILLRSVPICLVGFYILFK